MKTSNAKWLLIAGLVGPGLVYANDEQDLQRRDTPQQQGQLGAEPSGMSHQLKDKMEQGQSDPIVRDQGIGGSAQAGMLDATQSETLVKVHDTNQHEVRMGNLAKAQAMSHDVKKYGERLVKDHEAADKKVLDFAKKHNVQLSAVEPKDDWQQKKTEKHQKMVELQKLQGAEFDRQFLTGMVQGHDEAIAMLTEARAGNPDSDEAKLLGDLLPTLRQHRDDATKLLTKLEKTPAKARRPAGTR